MKPKASGRDKTEAIQATLGEGYNARHAYTRYLSYMASLLIVSWDATAPDASGVQQPIPVNPFTLVSVVDDEEDYQQLLDEAGKRVTLRGEAQPDAEENLEASSTQSSPETSSPTPESSPSF